MSVGFRRGEGRRLGLSRRLLCALCVELCVEFLPGRGASLRRSSGEGRAVDHTFAAAATHTFAGLAGIAGLAG